MEVQTFSFNVPEQAEGGTYLATIVGAKLHTSKNDDTAKSINLHVSIEDVGDFFTFVSLTSTKPAGQKSLKKLMRALGNTGAEVTLSCNESGVFEDLLEREVGVVLVPDKEDPTELTIAFAGFVPPETITDEELTGDEDY